MKKNDVDEMQESCRANADMLKSLSKFAENLKTGKYKGKRKESPRQAMIEMYPVFKKIMDEQSLTHKELYNFFIEEYKNGDIDDFKNVNENTFYSYLHAGKIEYEKSLKNED